MDLEVVFALQEVAAMLQEKPHCVDFYRMSIIESNTSNTAKSELVNYILLVNRLSISTVAKHLEKVS